jgi:methyl-accepting chemotaxis protein
MEKQIAEAEGIVGSIRKLQQGNEHVRQFYRALVNEFTEHHNKVAAGIAEMLGQIQFQDVVRQRIERVASAVTQRNDLLKELPQLLAEQTDLTRLPGQMQAVLDEYLANEARHASAIGDMAGEVDGLPKLQLF